MQTVHPNSYTCLLTEAQLGAGAQAVDDIDDQAMGGGSQGQGTSRHQQGHYVEEEGQVTGHIQ